MVWREKNKAGEVNEGCGRPGLQFNTEVLARCRWQDGWTIETGRKWRSWPRVRPVPGRMFRAESSTGLCPAAAWCLTGSSECLEQREEGAKTRRWRETVCGGLGLGRDWGQHGKPWESLGRGFLGEGAQQGWTSLGLLRALLCLSSAALGCPWVKWLPCKPHFPSTPAPQTRPPRCQFFKAVMYKSEKKKKIWQEF